jgi:hypothetical protein
MKTKSDAQGETCTTSGACPTFFVGNVITAKCSREGYAEAGYHLAIHMREMVENEVEDHVLADLDQVVGKHPEQLDRIWAWMQRVLPRCMRLVPARRKDSFLRGVERALEEGRV